MRLKKTIVIGSVLIALIMIFSFFKIQGQGSLSVGDTLPSFTLLDQNGQSFNMDDHIGKSAIVIYFYPKDDTPGCTKEACGFRDSYTQFKDMGIELIGVSSDDVETHKNFAKKYKLPYTLLADTDQIVRNLFGIKGSVLGLIPGRVTFVADKNGKIIFIYDNQFKAEKHIEESLNAIKKAMY